MAQNQSSDFVFGMAAISWKVQQLLRLVDWLEIEYNNTIFYVNMPEKITQIRLRIKPWSSGYMPPDFTELKPEGPAKWFSFVDTSFTGTEIDFAKISDSDKGDQISIGNKFELVSEREIVQLKDVPNLDLILLNFAQLAFDKNLISNDSFKNIKDALGNDAELMLQAIIDEKSGYLTPNKTMKLIVELESQDND